MILWFRHNEGKGCSLNDFYLSRKYQEETQTDNKEPKCGSCGRKQGEDPLIGIEKVDLKFCSRCKKVLYCSKECQKKNYRVHKRYCLTLS